jgi:N-dimethylarginine dimethylaminohydrolase
MCPPTYFTVRDVKNPFMTSQQRVDPQRALEQWNALRAAFDDAGVAVQCIDPAVDLEDMVFAANQAFVGHGRRNANFVVPSRMRYPSREREVPYYVRWFAGQGYTIVDLNLRAGDQEYLEGHGDLVPCGSRVWAGHGFRSSLSGVQKFAAAMRSEEIDVVPLQLVDATFYHLDTCFAVLNDEAALLYPAALAPNALEAVRAGIPRVHEVTREEAEAFVCNGIAVGGRFIASHLPARIERIVREEGLTPVMVDTSEFEKAGGSVFCLKCFL